MTVLRQPFALFALLAATVAVYWAGLSGPFLLDDYANLNALGAFGGVHDRTTLLLYLQGGIAGVGGRPIALMSFLLDDNGWPSTPWSFKYTNLMLHLLCGILLLLLIRQILDLSRPDQARKNLWMALVAAGFWLLHPLNVSTVLYVVQRMAILSAIFTVLALLAYIYGRSRLADTPKTAYAIMTLAMTFGTALAVFSKENGALTPALALVLEQTLPSKTSSPKPGRTWKAIFLWLPLLMIIAYMAYRHVNGSFNDTYIIRSFNLPERLLTEACILWDYIFRWLIPRSNNPGLFTEDFPVSTDFIHPWYTLPAVLGWLSVFVLAIKLRQRQPMFSAAALFFMTGHLIESTIIPLELYFEHRNYLPAMLLIQPAICLAAEKFSKTAKMVSGILILLIPAALTAWLALLWGDAQQLSFYWAQSHPDSERAQGTAAETLNSTGRPDLALKVLDRALARHPNNVNLELNRLVLKCFVSGLQPDDISRTMSVAKHGQYTFRTFDQLQELVLIVNAPACRGLKSANVHAILDALMANKAAQLPSAKRQMLHLHGLLEIRDHNTATAFQWFTQSQLARPDPDLGLLETGILATAGEYALALKHLDRIDALIATGAQGPKSPLDYATESRHLRHMIELDISKSASAAEPAEQGQKP